MVTRAGYAALHIRIAKVLNADFDKATAEDVANSDWAEDITAFTVRQRAHRDSGGHSCSPRASLH